MRCCRPSSRGRPGIGSGVLLIVVGVFVVLAVIAHATDGILVGPGLVVVSMILVISILFCTPPGYSCRRPRSAEEILAEIDRLDEREAAEEEFEPLFDELLGLAEDGDADLDREIVRRMNSAEGPSRRMFLRLAAAVPRLHPALRELAAGDHPLAPEARERLPREDEA